jgi:tRNA A-37 threonylcarbamoyl transferase component Bud32
MSEISPLEKGKRMHSPPRKERRMPSPPRKGKRTTSPHKKEMSVSPPKKEMNGSPHKKEMSVSFEGPSDLLFQEDLDVTPLVKINMKSSSEMQNDESSMQYDDVKLEELTDILTGRSYYTIEEEKKVKIRNIKKFINESSFPYKIDNNKLLGEGKFGLVYEAYKEILSGEGKEPGYVIKIFIPEDSKEDYLFDHEVKMLKYILKQCGTCEKCPEFLCYVDNYNHMYIKLLVLKNAGKNLKTFLIENPKLDGAIREELCEQLSDAITKLHHYNVFHGDLKPDNITIYENEGTYTLKIIDFGVATFLDEMDEIWMGNTLFYDHSISPINKETKIKNEINAINEIKGIIINPTAYLKNPADFLKNIERKRLLSVSTNKYIIKAQQHNIYYNKYLKYKMKYMKLKMKVI